MRPYQPGLKDRLPLRARESGRADLLLDVIHEYTVVHVPDDEERGPWKVQSKRYCYEIFDLNDRELLLYHWHPEGVSDVKFPHIHASCTPTTLLPRSSADMGREINIAKFHLPTNRVLLEDVIELLIRDFEVEPHNRFRDTWEDVLRSNREAVRRGSTWSWRGNERAN